MLVSALGQFSSGAYTGLNIDERYAYQWAWIQLRQTYLDEDGVKFESEVINDNENLILWL